MSKWLFFPLRDNPLAGVLKAPDGSVSACKCMTLAEAKRRASEGRR